MNLPPLPEWLMPLWQDITKRRDRLPHALLLAGAPGSGKRLFAEQLCAALLCQHPTEDGFACGQCDACHWLASGNHPDVLRVVPAADQEEASEEGEGGEAPAKKEKSKSSQIVIDQVRSIQSVLEVGAGGRRVVIVEPVEAMNVAAANAMLKMLEEPGQGTVFLLVCHAPRRLLPTILSRCQKVAFGRPSAPQVKHWIASCGIKDAEALLGFCSGLPLLVERMHQQGLDDIRRQLATELVRLPNSDPLKVAAQWEARLKAKEADERGLNLALLISWIQCWLADGARVASGAMPRFYLDYKAELATLSNGRGQAWTGCFREFHAYRGVAQHPLNLRLLLEEMFLVLHRRTTLVRR